jgi:hypothetical protein
VTHFTDRQRTLGDVRVLLIVLGVMLVVTGTIWIFQGVGMLKGSFMTGSAFWMWMGVAAVIVGVPLLARGIRRAAR